MLDDDGNDAMARLSRPGDSIIPPDGWVVSWCGTTFAMPSEGSRKDQDVCLSLGLWRHVALDQQGKSSERETERERETR